MPEPRSLQSTLFEYGPKSPKFDVFFAVVATPFLISSIQFCRPALSLGIYNAAIRDEAAQDVGIGPIVARSPLHFFRLFQALFLPCKTTLDSPGENTRPLFFEPLKHYRARDLLGFRYGHIEWDKVNPGPYRCIGPPDRGLVICGKNNFEFRHELEKLLVKKPGAYLISTS